LTQHPSSSGHATADSGISHFADLSLGSIATPAVNNQPMIQMMNGIQSSAPAARRMRAVEQAPPRARAPQAREPGVGADFADQS